MNKYLGITLLVSVVGAAAAALAMGPLNPPAGAVSSTSPSLADIQTLISSQANQSTDGPWQIYVIDSRDMSASQNASIVINAKPVLLHSINAYRVSAYAFNGSGLLSGAGTITSGDVVGQVVQALSPGAVGEPIFHNSNQAVFDVVCEDGLELSWTYDGTPAYFIHVYYKVLE